MYHIGKHGAIKMKKSPSIIIDTDGIPLIVLDDHELEKDMSNLKFCSILDNKNNNLKDVLEDLKKFINRNKRFKFFNAV
jgi:hypothetical protein